jgi:hypothetical protein
VSDDVVHVQQTPKLPAVYARLQIYMLQARITSVHLRDLKKQKGKKQRGQGVVSTLRTHLCCEMSRPHPFLRCLFSETVLPCLIRNFFRGFIYIYIYRFFTTFQKYISHLKFMAVANSNQSRVTVAPTVVSNGGRVTPFSLKNHKFLWTRMEMNFA